MLPVRMNVKLFEWALWAEEPTAGLKSNAWPLCVQSKDGGKHRLSENQGTSGGLAQNTAARLHVSKMSEFIWVCLCVCKCLHVTISAAESKIWKKCLEGARMGDNLGPPWPLLWLAGAQLCRTGHLPARGQICPQPHKHTHASEAEIMQQKDAHTQTKSRIHVSACHTRIVYSDVCLFVSLWGWGTFPFLSEAEGSSGQRKIL